MTRAALSIEIREEPPAALAAYGTVPIAFEVRETLVVRAPDSGLGGLHLDVRPVPEPWTKDYDAYAGEGPERWNARFDTRGWGILSAWVQGGRVGGAVVVHDSPDVRMLDGRTDLAVLWDLRVASALRGRGIGDTLFRASERWARARGASWLKIETQNINVPACRFYARQGCTLGAANRFAYPELPEETQLLWYKRLG